jgi:hypothetical protein
VPEETNMKGGIPVSLTVSDKASILSYQENVSDYETPTVIVSKTLLKLISLAQELRHF